MRLITLKGARRLKTSSKAPTVFVLRAELFWRNYYEFHCQTVIVSEESRWTKDFFFFYHHRRASMCVNKTDDCRPCDYKVTRKLGWNSYMKARCWYEGWTFCTFEFVFRAKFFFCIFKDVDLDGNFQNILIRLWAFLSFWERYIDVKDFAWKDKFVVRYRNWGFLMFILALF